MFQTEISSINYWQIRDLPRWWYSCH